MIFTMNTDTFADKFLNVLPDDFILDCNYIILSDRISLRTSEFPNATSISLLYPDTLVMMVSGIEPFVKAYQEQLESPDAKNVIIDILRLQFEKPNENIILLTSTKELKGYNFIKHFRDIVYNMFQYFIYDFEEWLYLDDAEIEPCPDIRKTLKLMQDARSDYIDFQLKNTIALGNHNDDVIEKYITDTIKEMNKNDIVEYLKSIGEKADTSMSKKTLIDMVVNISV